MKKVLILLMPFLLFGLSGCTDDTKETKQSDKTYVGDISNKATFEKYLSYSSSYTEQGSSQSGFYVVITVNITSLDSNFYFENLQISITGDKVVTKKYSVPTNGTLTVTCNSTSYSSRDDRAYYLMTLTAGNLKTATGKVYKTK